MPYPPDPEEYPLDESGNIDWGAYWRVANEYARNRTAQYTDEERLLAKAIYTEQREPGASLDANRKAMIAIGYVIRHRCDENQGWFGATNTIQAVVEDTRTAPQFQGYWQWRNLDIVEDYLVNRLGFESSDRTLWFDALDIARRVLQGSKLDPMPDSVGFGHGDERAEMMRTRKIALEADPNLRIKAVLGAIPSPKL